MLLLRFIYFLLLHICFRARSVIRILSRGWTRGVKKKRKAIVTLESSEWERLPNRRKKWGQAEECCVHNLGSRNPDITSNGGYEHNSLNDKRESVPALVPKPTESMLPVSSRTIRHLCLSNRLAVRGQGGGRAGPRGPLT
jgi:hypothetical protein